MRLNPYEIIFSVLLFLVPTFYVVYHLVISNFYPGKWERFYAKRSDSPSFFSRFLGFSVPLSCAVIAAVVGSLLSELSGSFIGFLLGGLAACGFSVLALRSFSNSMQGPSLNSFLNWSAKTSLVLFVLLFSSVFIDISSVFSSSWLLVPWAVTAVLSFSLKTS